jgi:hypothetical protein
MIVSTSPDYPRIRPRPEEVMEGQHARRARVFMEILNRHLRLKRSEGLAFKALQAVSEVHLLDAARSEWASTEDEIAEIRELLEAEVRIDVDGLVPPRGSLGDALRLEYDRVLTTARSVGPEYAAGYAAGYSTFRDRFWSDVTRVPDPPEFDPDAPPTPSAQYRMLAHACRYLPTSPDERRIRWTEGVLSVLNWLVPILQLPTGRRDPRRRGGNEYRTLPEIAQLLVDALPELIELEEVRDRLADAMRTVHEDRVRLRRKRVAAGLSADEARRRADLAQSLRAAADGIGSTSVGVGSDFASGYDAACNRIVRTLRERAGLIDVRHAC